MRTTDRTAIRATLCADKPTSINAGLVLSCAELTELWAAIEELEDAAWSGGAESMRVHLNGGPWDLTWENKGDAERARVRALLGMEPES